MEQFFKVCTPLRRNGFRCIGFCDQYVFGCPIIMLMSTEIIAADALDAISRHGGFVDALGDGNAETRLWKSYALCQMQTKVGA